MLCCHNPTAYQPHPEEFPYLFVSCPSSGLLSGDTRLSEPFDSAILLFAHEPQRFFPAALPPSFDPAQLLQPQASWPPPGQAHRADHPGQAPKPVPEVPPDGQRESPFKWFFEGLNPSQLMC